MRALGSGKQPATIVLAAVIAALAAALIACALSGTHVAPLLATAPIELSSPVQGFPAPAVPLDSADLEQATLFYASRRYFAPPKSAPSVQAPPYILIGTLLIPGKPALAFLKNDSTSASVKVAVGDMLQGWKVQAVESRNIVITAGKQRLEIGPGGSKGTHPSLASATVTALRPTPHGGLIRLLGHSQPPQPQRSAIHSPPTNAMANHYRAPPGYVIPGEKINVNRLYRGTRK